MKNSKNIETEKAKQKTYQSPVIAITRIGLEGDILLDELKTYTLIAYSKNSSSTAPPKMTIANSNVKTIARARVSVS
ncbi:hypothetical protein ACL9RF_04275 [Sphingobacterium sp. Mn56C]|uniref:hypothetical protein n=1 Tax=Sphingobacterium sp. Mn56C TaxID=3395261 RepID=UPI003BCA548F